MFTEAGYLLFWSLALSVLSGLVLAWPLGRALGKGRHARPGFFRLALLCALSQFSALALHVLGGMALGMPRPPIRPEPLSWLINAALLALCFVFLAKKARHGNRDRPPWRGALVHRTGTYPSLGPFIDFPGGYTAELKRGPQAYKARIHSGFMRTLPPRAWSRSARAFSFSRGRYAFTGT